MSISPAPASIKTGPAQVTPSQNLLIKDQPLRGPSVQDIGRKVTTPAINHGEAGKAKLSIPAPSAGTPTPTRHEPPPDLDDYLNLRDQHEDIVDELAALDQDIAEHDKAYDQRLQEKKDYRDKELPHLYHLQQQELLVKQKAEQDEMRSMQKAEAHKLKEEYIRMKAGRDDERKPLLDQGSVKVQAQLKLEEDMDRKKEVVSKDDLLEFVLAQQSAGKKRKHEESKGEVQKKFD